MKDKIKCKRIGVKIVSFIMVMMLAISSVMTFYVDEAEAATGGVKTKLDSVLQSYPVGYTWNSSYGGCTQCFGWARLVFNRVFGCDMPSAYKGSKRYEYSTETNVDKIYQLSGGGVNTSSVQAMFSWGKPGDIIQGCGSTYGQHTMVLYSVSSTGIVIYDCNSAGDCKIKRQTKTWSQLANRYSSSSAYPNNGITLYRAKNYDAIDNVGPADTTPPSMSNARLVSIDKDGYTVACEVTDNVGLDRVEFPTWTEANGQDDIIWGRGSKNGNTYTYRVNISSHGNQIGKYTTHFYSWDTAGNKAFGGGFTVNIEHDRPSISNVKVVDVDTRYITVSCTATDSSGISKVEFPTWTKKDGQDDLKWHQYTSKSGSTYYCKIDRAEHNFELSDLYVDVYGTDSLGNFGYGSGIFIPSVLGDKQNLGSEFIATIKNQYSGTVLTADADGNITGRANKGEKNQKWVFVRNSDNTYTIKSVADTNKVIDNSGAQDSNANNIWVYPSNGSNAQKWKIYKVGSGYVMVSACSDSKCIDLAGGSPAEGTNVQLYQVSASIAGLFSIEKEKTVAKPDPSPSKENEKKEDTSSENNSNNKDTKNTSQNTNNSNSDPSTSAVNAGTDAYTQSTNSNTKRGLIESFVFRMYSVALGRQADSEGLKYWSDQLESGKMDAASVAEGFINSPEFKNRSLSDYAYIDVLYRTFFDRHPDAGGRDNWIAELSGGKSREAVLAGFVNSAEFEKLCNKYGIKKGSMTEDGKAKASASSSKTGGVRDFVLRNYTEALGRTGEEAGVNYWTQKIESGEMGPLDVSMSFFHSEEFLNKHTSNREFVEILYHTFLGRGSDSAGLNYWTTWLDFGVDRDVVMEGFAYSKEFFNIMANYGLR